MIFRTHLARRQTTALEDSGGEVRPWRGQPRIRQRRRREGCSVKARLVYRYDPPLGQLFLDE